MIDVLADQIQRDGFVFSHADDTRLLLGLDAGSDWQGFAASWNDLGVDTFMADGGRYRRRRFSAFSVDADGATPKPPQPHYQSRDYNTLNGGIERWFEPLLPSTLQHPVLAATLNACRALFHPLTPAPLRPAAWHAEVHQFRISAAPGQEGRPTPEGLHRDGVDWVLVLLVARVNVAHGTTVMHNLEKRETGRFTLVEPLDAALLDDSRVYHGVTAIEPVDPALPAFRDVLVVTFRR